MPTTQSKQSQAAAKQSQYYATVTAAWASSSLWHLLALPAHNFCPFPLLHRHNQFELGARGHGDPRVCHIPMGHHVGPPMHSWHGLLRAEWTLHWDIATWVSLG